MEAAFTPAEFSDLMPSMQIGQGARIAVGVSGGADSMALTLLLGKWCQANGVSLTALTVDHGLRPAAADEARRVGRWLKKYDISHRILTWDGTKPASNIQGKARLARYGLMGEWCQQHDADRLFLAHHRGDQAETFLMRLFRGSGVDGLSAMKPWADFPVPLPPTGGDIKLCRPLLSVPKDRLIATLQGKDQPWIEDPGNQNNSYMRVQMRNLLAQSEIEGLNEDRMAKTAARMGRVRHLLHILTDELESVCVTYFPEGYAELNLPSLLSAHGEISLRLLARVIGKVSGSRYGPRMTRLEDFYNRIAKDDFQGQTLGGCLLSPLCGNRIMICRESAAIRQVILLGRNQTVIWDGRFRIEPGAEAGEVRKIDTAAWQKLCQENPELKKLKLGPAVRETLPALYGEDGRIILPDFMPGFEKAGFLATYKSFCGKIR